jgi:hypothetical protein
VRRPDLDLAAVSNAWLAGVGRERESRAASTLRTLWKAVAGPDTFNALATCFHGFVNIGGAALLMAK